MRIILALFTSACFLTSCSSGPSAGIEISNPNPKLGETFRIENTSEGGDITYITMDGPGVMNKYTQIGAGVQITDPRFNFQYLKPGNYKIEVVVENSTAMGGASIESASIAVNVIDPDAKPVVPTRDPAMDGVVVKDIGK